MPTLVVFQLYRGMQNNIINLDYQNITKIKYQRNMNTKKILRPIPGVLEPVVKSCFTNQFCGVSGIIVTSQTCLMELFAKHSNNLKSVVFPWGVKRQMENGLSLGEHI